jgi:4-hydroxy-2-oxoheptanedioate aldolase
VQSNRTREKLAQDRTVLGCLLRYPDAGVAELLALQGLDFVVFDGEHGTLTPEACEHMVRAVQLHGVTPAVRVEENRATSILRYLDAGALICHVPGVESREDAVRAVRAAKYYPAGTRGLAASRSSGYGAGDGYPAYVAAANRETQVVVHIESAAGVAAVQEIAEVDGVDVLFVGTLDLSHDLGHPGELEHPAVLAGTQRVAAAASNAGKTLGAVVGDPAGIERWVDCGARYLMTTLESFVRPGVGRFLAEIPDGR